MFLAAILSDSQSVFVVGRRMRRDQPQRIHKRKDVRILFGRLLDHDTDAQTKKRLREIDDSLSCRCYRERRDRQVRLALDELANQAVPADG